MNVSAPSLALIKRTGTLGGCSNLFEDVVETAILEQPIAQARPAEQRDQDEPIDQQNRSRKRLELREDEHDRQEDEHGQAHRAGDVEKIGREAKRQMPR